MSDVEKKSAKKVRSPKELLRWREPSDSEIRAARRDDAKEEEYKKRRRKERHRKHEKADDEVVVENDGDDEDLDEFGLKENIWRHEELMTRTADSEAQADSDVTQDSRADDETAFDDTALSDAFSNDEEMGYGDGERVTDMDRKRQQRRLLAQHQAAFDLEEKVLSRRHEDTFDLAPLPVVTKEDWISLNVGGRLFTTTRTTLTKYPLSMLGRMFDGTQWLSAQDESGAYLIDHDPNHFEAILNYLRTGEVILPHAITLQGLLASARFFQLLPMMDEIELQIEEQQRLHYQYVVMRWGPTINPEAVWLYGPISERLSQSKEFENFHPRKLAAENLTFLEAVTFYDDVVVIMNVLGRHGWDLVSSSTEKDGLKGQQFTFKKMATRSAGAGRGKSGALSHRESPKSSSTYSN